MIEFKQRKARVVTKNNKFYFSVFRVFRCRIKENRQMN